MAGVHGISQQQGGRNQLIGSWQLALRDGVERARGRDFSKPSLDIAFYGDRFLKSSESKGPVPDDLIEFDEDTVAFFEAIQDEVTERGKWGEPDQADEAAGAAKGLRELPSPLAKLAWAVERRSGVAGKVLFFGDLTQVRRYQRDDELARDVLGTVREVLDRGRPQVMIGHSLGSIVGYEALCAIPDHGIRTLITIGSPLGLRGIRDALRPAARNAIPGLPPGVSTWVNVYDKHDPVALAGPLRPYWGAVVDRIVDNGDDPHAATRYLGKSETGDPVASAMTAS